MGDRGTLAERFELQDELGRGAMGVVFRARERSTGRDVALKVLHEGSADPDLAARARREAELQARLDHPGIVAVHAAGDDGGRPWIASELVPGARKLDVAWRELDRAARVATVRDVARALGHAHARGVVHRDVKADNVLVDATGRPRLTDFGIALHRAADRLTRTGELLGTPHAMAPEQVLSDRGAVGPATDVWAAGVLLYEALTGERPFPGRTLPAVAEQILAGAPRPPRAVDPTIPVALERVVLQALSADPAARPPDGEALARAIEAAMRAPAAGRSVVALSLVAAALALIAALVVRGSSPGPTPPPATEAPPTARPFPEPATEPATTSPVVTSAPPAATEAPLPPIPEPTEPERLRLGKSPTDPARLREVGKALLDGTGLEPSPERAVEWLAAAAARGDRKAASLLWERAADLRLSAAELERWQLVAARLEDSDAMNAVSKRLQDAGDRPGAVSWAERVYDAKGGHPLAALRLAQLLDDSLGGGKAPVDQLQRAVRLYREALAGGAERLNAELQRTVAEHLVELALRRPDAFGDFEALRATVERASHGEGRWVATLDRNRPCFEAYLAAHGPGGTPEDFVRLGKAHTDLARLGGPELERHQRRAAIAFRHAAEAGLLEAQVLLGRNLLSRGSPQLALPWLEEATRRGDLEAASLLAELLADGRPVPPDDLLRARSLADVAAASSDEAVAARARAVRATLEGR